MWLKYFFDKKILYCFLFFLMGSIYSILNFEIIQKTDTSIYKLEIFDTPHTFYNILSNNIIVGLLISIGGYFSGGFLVIVILFWNGFFLSEIILTSIALNIPHREIIYGTIYHGIIEIFALLIFGKIGLKGWEFYKRIFYKNKFTLHDLNIKYLLIPIILLLISAVIESNL